MSALSYRNRPPFISEAEYKRGVKSRLAEGIKRDIAIARTKLERAKQLPRKRRVAMAGTAGKLVERWQSVIAELPESILRRAATAKRLARVMAEVNQVAGGAKS